MCAWYACVHAVKCKSTSRRKLNRKIVIFAKRVRKECSRSNVSAVISFSREQF